MTSDRYHHGDLPNALRRAAVDVIDERGLGAFSLREVARRAGVSHTAPAHHFGCVRGLLTAVALEGFEELDRVLSEAAGCCDDPVERLTAIGHAYFELGRSHHAHCEVMFRTDVIDPDDECLSSAAASAYEVLAGTIREIVDAEGLDVDVDDATWLCWSAMQGLVVIEPKIRRLDEVKGGGELSTTDLVRRFTQIIVAGLRNVSPTP